MASTTLLVHTHSFVDVFHDRFTLMGLNFVDTALNFPLKAWMLVGLLALTLN